MNPYETAIQGQEAYLQCQLVVLLNEVILALGPIGDGTVHFEHTGVARAEHWHQTLHHSAAESFPVHAFTKVELFCGYDSMQVPTKIAVPDEIFSEHQLHEFDFFHT